MPRVMAAQPKETPAARSCGGCTACCQVVPVAELGLLEYQGCPHVRSVIHAAGPGCGIYANRPSSCRMWRCGWLENGDWEDDLRPDRCGFIVDEVLDLIKVNEVERPAVQIWALPGHEKACEQQPAIAVILAVLHDGMGAAVLWRLPDGRAVGFHLFDGKPCMSEPTPVGKTLGSTSERIRRAAQLMAEKK